MSIYCQLKKIRIERNISFDQIEHHLKISRNYIIALENEDFTALPNEVFIKGYTNLYARFLGLNNEYLTLTTVFKPDIKYRQQLKLSQNVNPSKKIIVFTLIVFLNILYFISPSLPKNQFDVKISYNLHQLIEEKFLAKQDDLHNSDMAFTLSSADDK